MNKQRIVTTLVLTPLVIAAVLLPPTPYVAAIAAAVFLLGLWEWSRMVGIASRPWRALYVMVNIALMTALLWGHGLPLFGPVCVIGVIWWLIAVLWLLFWNFARDDNWWTRAVKLAAGTLATVPAWCALVLLHYGNSGENLVDVKGPRWALLALVIVWVADSCAYVVGVRFGKRKLIPHISPGKTWMGLWGGIAGGVAISLIGAPLVGVRTDQMTAMAELALLTVVASVVGDLFESLMKRHSGMKDSGTLIPGHGGMLDRLDSLLAALPVLWIAKGWLDL
jgi:phosphatidate cytidylyltransferase